MEMSQLEIILTKILLLGVGVFFILAVVAVIALIVVYIKDVSQNKHAILKNYPIIGHLRYFFEHLGKYFRQYFFALDRAELPFNRAQRSWVYRASKDIDVTSAFGSTRGYQTPGTVFFANCPYPTMAKRQ